MNKDVKNTGSRAELAVATGTRKSVGKIIVVVLLAIVAVASLVLAIFNSQINNFYKTITAGVEFDPDNVAVVVNEDSVDKITSTNKIYTEIATNDAFKTDAEKAKDNYIANSGKAQKSEDIYTYVIYGLDALDADKDAQADAITLATINKKTKEIKFVSIDPESLVYIPDAEVVGLLKHAYNFGGANLMVKTISQNFRVYINGFIEMNLESAKTIVQNLGTIPVEMTAEELASFNTAVDSYNKRYPTSPVTKIDSTKAGTYDLDQNQAMAYIRGVNSERQNQIFTVMKASAKKAMANGYDDFKKFVEETIGNGISAGISEEDFNDLMQVAMFSMGDLLENEMGTVVFGSSDEAAKENKKVGNEAYSVYNYEVAVDELNKAIH